MPGDIVCMPNAERYYSNKPELLAKLRASEESGTCPFCEPHIKNELVFETRDWNVVLNQYPYTNSRLHLLLLPKRHITCLSQMDMSELTELSEVLHRLKARYPFLHDGFGLAVRTGQLGGVTLHHLHWHLIAPQVDEAGQIPVEFKIG